MADNAVLGNYRLLRLIGEGSFASVYVGEHIYLNTYAALKVPKLQLAREDLEGFLNEARTSIGLHHPYIVRTLECGVQGGTTPYIVMEYAPGGSLRARYPRGTPLPPPAIIAYVKQAGSALQYIHDRGLIHQDIKPGNTLLNAGDDVLLSDFGLVTVAHRTMSQAVQDMAGTARYMAPEQFQGKARPASDQYALAIMVYEWISGATPFDGTLTELYSQHTYTPPPPLHEKVPSISPAVEQVIMRALAKDPRDRFARVQDFVDALDLAGQPSPAVSPVSPVSSASLVSSPSLAALQDEEEIPTLHGHEPPRVQRTAEAIPPPIPVEERQPNEDTILTVLSQRSQPAQPQVEVLEAPITPAPPIGKRPRVRRRTAALLVGLVLILIAASIAFFTSPLFRGQGAGGTPTVSTHVTPSPPPPYSPMFGFNAQHTRYNPGETILRTANVAQLKLSWKMSTSSPIYSSPLVSNGLVYITSSDNKLYAFSALTGAKQWEMSTGNCCGKGSFIYSSPSILNGVVYVGSDDKRVYAFNASTGQTLWVSLPTGGSIFSSPTIVNGILYIGSTDHKIYAFDATNGKSLWAVPIPTGGEVYSSPAVFNNVVYIGSDDSKLYALNATTGNILWTGTVQNHIDASPTVVDGVVYIGASDGDVYAFTANGCGHTTCDPLWTAATGNFINSSPAVANGILYIGSHDSKLYAYDTTKCKNAPTTCAPLWAAMTGGEIDSSPTVANGVVYVGSWDGKIYAFDAKTGTKLWSFATGARITSSPIVLDGMLYVGSTDHTLYAFHI